MNKPAINFFTDYAKNGMESAKENLRLSIDAEVVKAYPNVPLSDANGKRFLDATVKAQYELKLKELNKSFHSFAGEIVSRKKYGSTNSIK